MIAHAPLAASRALVIGFAAIFAAVWLAPPHHGFEGLAGYLPLHSFLEVVSIIVAAMVFGIAWNAYSRERSASLLLLGCGLLGVALIDFAHALSYPGMPGFVTPSGTEKAIFFWLAARLLAAAALLGAALARRRPVADARLRYLLLGGALGIVAAVYWIGLYRPAQLPRTFIEGAGLTPAKVAAEYFLVVLFASAAALFHAGARRSGAPELALLFAAAAVSALSELCFTLYAEVTDAFNLLGHVYKVVAYAFIYRAVFVAAVRAPFESAQERARKLAHAERIAHIGSWQVDLPGNRLTYSAEALRIHGLEAEAFDGTLSGAIALAHPEDRQRLRQAIHATLYEGRPFAIDYRILRPDGSVRFVHAEDEVFRDAAGVPVRAFGITQDVTERRQAEQAVREGEERLRLLTDSIPAMIAYVDGDARYRYANRRYRVFYGGSDAPLDGRRLADVLLPEVWEEVRPRIERALRGETLSYSGERRLHDGSVRHVSVSLVPHLDGAGNVVGLYILVLDVSAQHQAETALRESEAGLRRAQALAGLAHLVVGPDGSYERWSEGWPRLMGLEGAPLPRNVRESMALVHPEDRARFRAAVIESQRTRRTAALEYRMKRADGALVHLRQTMEPLGETDGGAPPYWFVTLQDVTPQKLAEDRIRRLNRVYAVLSGINGAIVRIRERRELFQEACRVAVAQGGFRFAWICMVDRQAGRLVPAASAGRDHGFLERVGARLSLRDDAPQGHGVASVAAREARAVFVNDVERDPLILDKALHRERGIRSVGTLPIMVDGAPFAVLGLHSPEAGFFDQEEQRLLLELAGDIAFALEHIAKEEKVRYLAYYDQLTGLANRTLFLERLGQHLAAPRDGARRTGLAIVNIDRFKTINDTFGRQVGDALLRQVAARLVEIAGNAANVGRVGSDQFAVVVPRVLEDERLVRRLEEGSRRLDGAPYDVEGHELRISTRAGVALSPEDGADPDTLFRNAEAALKSAVSGDRFIFYAPKMTERVADRLRLENQMRQALERSEFVLHYQPKVDLAARRIVGAEALIRWQSPQLGLVPPMDFIPLLEQTGMINEVGAWAIGRALQDRARWPCAPGAGAPRVAVNVSARQLRRPDFAESLRGALAGAADGGGLDLEITESLVMEDIERTIGTLNALRALQVQIAVDDFGTGHSSLAYLGRLPVAALKIDRLFIREMDSPEAMSLVSTIISLGHSLGLRVIAEGVETEQQAKYLALLRCDEAQGYLFGRPMPAQALQALLEERPTA